MKSRIKLFMIFIFTFFVFSCKKEKNIVDSRPKDIDGNVYDTVVIGSQVWMVQNLKTTRYNDGTPIPTNLDNTEWEFAISGAYSIYDDSIQNNNTYGKLYNWYAVNTGKLAPKGWHVPTESEWTTLAINLGGETIAGGKMKSTNLWNNPNTGATNSSGFSALPAGDRYTAGFYSSKNEKTIFWTATSVNALQSETRVLLANNAGLLLNYAHNYAGLSVRCIRD